VVNIEDAGFEIRDQIMWIYGSGFPKSLDVSKAIDKEAGAERVIVGQSQYASRRPNLEYEHAQKWGSSLGGTASANITAPATEAAKQWEGWGTALKPAHEPIAVARKPLIGTVAENVRTHGTGAINIDGCRVSLNGERVPTGSGNADKSGTEQQWGFVGNGGNITSTQGRWPANVIHDGSDEVLAGFPESTGGGGHWANTAAGFGEREYNGKGRQVPKGGNVARFFYCAKASKADRDAGLDGFEVKQATGGGGGVGDYLQDVNSASGKYGSEKAPARNNHPTVKPTELMRYLCRLVTPPNGTVLDPFAGSGSTGKAASLEGFSFIGIEREAEYVEIAKARIASTMEPLLAG
jgi:hypothetical protein